MRIVVMCSCLAVIVALSGCEKYRAQPLNGTATVNSIAHARQLLDDNAPATENTAAPPAIAAPFTFARAAALLRDHSPALSEVRAEYATALATANVKTPLPNPSVEAGPRYGFGSDVLTHRFQPFGALGFSIPTGQRLTRQDEVNQAHAELAYIETIARHRELYMQLRRNYSKLSLSQQRLAARKGLATSASQSLTATRKAFDAGHVNAVDVVLFELDDARLQAAVLDAKGDVAASRGDLSQLIGVSAEIFDSLPEHSLPQIPELPAPDTLRQLMIDNHPDLARLRSRYEAAERELHLEISKQYPDFRVGPAADGDVGDRKTTLGLTLGIDLPIFDRNQQAIATAKSRRDEIRLKFEATANRLLADLERATLGCALAQEKSKLLNDVLLPRGQAGIDLARKSFDLGATDVLHFLEAERAHRSIEIEAIDAELAIRGAFIDLEQAVGCPLVLFPTESSADAPGSIQTAMQDKENKE